MSIASLCGDCRDNDLVYGVTLPNLPNERRTLLEKKEEFTREEGKRLDFVGLPVYLNHEHKLPAVGITIAARYIEDERGARVETLHKLNKEAATRAADRSLSGTMSIVQRSQLMLAGHKGLSLGHSHVASKRSGSRIDISKAPFEISLCREGRRDGSEIASYLPCRNSLRRSRPAVVAEFARNNSLPTPPVDLLERAGRSPQEWSGYLDTLWPHIYERRMALLNQQGFVERLRRLDAGVVLASTDKSNAWHISKECETMSEAGEKKSEAMQTDAQKAPEKLKKTTTESVNDSAMDDDEDVTADQAAALGAAALELEHKNATNLRAENEKLRRDLEEFQAAKRLADKEKAEREKAELEAKNKEVVNKHRQAIDNAFEEVLAGLDEEDVDATMKTRENIKAKITASTTEGQLAELSDTVQTIVCASKTAQKKMNSERQKLMQRHTNLARTILSQSNFNKPDFVDPPAQASEKFAPPAKSVASSSSSAFPNMFGGEGNEKAADEESMSGTVLASKKRGFEDTKEELDVSDPKWVSTAFDETIANVGIIPTREMLAAGGLVRHGVTKASNGRRVTTEIGVPRFSGTVPEIRFNMSTVAPHLFEQIVTRVNDNFNGKRVDHTELHEMVDQGMKIMPKESGVAPKMLPVHDNPQDAFNKLYGYMRPRAY